ncbi:hypothetical protein [Actinocrispum wychmicini]|uniref:Uncharacterized protein n=1 Tax=Actinocrispum wychmicini TaxID=1213861 RepID=A0A4R2JJW9_9PSEU|nr:hypothetical protein [Actinocrispum wychmicini]TCO56819.1 hypothetical protein EV192_106294 [Actinocrispum wychmicini]
MSDPYRPGQYPPPGPDQTTRIPPVPGRPMPQRGPRPRPDGQRDKRREYLLKGLGLLLVAVVSGMLWWLIQQGGGSPDSAGAGASGKNKPPAGKYVFTKSTELSGPVRDSNCVEHSYRKVQTFFKTKNCTSLVRQLYSAPVNGKTAFASVAVVVMPTAQDAQDLKSLTEQDDTGNVADLVRDKKVKVGTLSNLSNGFAARVQDATVVIVEANYESGSKDADKQALDDVANDALRLGDELRQPG